MLVRMLTKIGGYRDFEEWPEIGGTIDLPKVEAERLIAGQLAEAADEGPKAQRDAKAEPESDSGPVADSDAATVDDSDDNAGSDDEGGDTNPAGEAVDGEATKPVGARVRKGPARAAKRSRRK